MKHTRGTFLNLNAGGVEKLAYSGQIGREGVSGKCY